MKKQKRPEHNAAAVKTAEPWRPKPWHYLAAAFAALLVLLELYGPALSGPFVFDDEYLPFALPGFDQRPFVSLLTGLRPVLLISYWLNHKMSAMQPYSYHLINVLLHMISGLLVFSVADTLLRRFETDVTRRLMLAGFAAGLFLLHPLQTESVAYVASRSETLSILFAYGAVALFLGQGEKGLGWSRAAAVLVLFGLACLTKEHAAVLPAVMLLADYYWHPGFSLEGIKRNWRLYAPLALGAAGAGRFVYNVLRLSDTAGFDVKGLAWYEYFFTQWRATPAYLRLFLAPFGQNVDHDFAMSRTPLEHGAVLGLVILLGLAAAAVVLRKRYPLTSFGMLVFFVLIAPTSSIVPIRDLFVERRFYLPSIGAVLVAADLFRIWPTKKSTLFATIAGVLTVCSVLTWQRNQVWGSAEALWSDAVAKSPNLMRPHSQLGLVFYNAGRCTDAEREFSRALEISPTEYRSLVDYGLTLDCLNRPDDALRAFQKAASVKRQGYPYALIGMIYGKQGKREEAMQAIEQALKIEPNNDMAYLYRGNLHFIANEAAQAKADYELALHYNPRNEVARTALQRIQRTAPQAQ